MTWNDFVKSHKYVTLESGERILSAEAYCFGKCVFCGGFLVGKKSHNYGVCLNCGAV